MRPMKAKTFLAFLDGHMTPVASIFDGRGFIPVVLRICPKDWISLVKK